MDSSKHYDVLIAGAGISGIAAGYHLQRSCPDKSFAIVEAREAVGGTWDLFRFPGVRSDSDMYTLGFSFRPWPREDRIGEGADIRRYIEDTAEKTGILNKIRFSTRIEHASFSTTEARWTLRLRDVRTGQTDQVTCNFFWACMGYYRYDRGYAPKLEGIEDFSGRIMHPQHWDDTVSYAGKRVLLIGSGATAMTMLPVLSKQAEKVTMVQRSPTYVFAWPRRDRLAIWLRKLLGSKRAHPIIRWKNIKAMALMYSLLRRFPRFGSWFLIRRARRRLGPDYDVETHFTPEYDPWDQRLCLVPDGDVFDAIAAGRAEVATGRIDRFTRRGLRLQSGEELDADVIVTATGFSLQWLGGVPLEVDGVRVRPEQEMVYKGCMVSRVPNTAFVFGYVNSSWTLRAELVSAYVCRLLRHMDAHGYRECCPVPDPRVEPRPLLDLSSSYVRRAYGKFPSQGNLHPWRFNQSYALDVALLRDQPIEDEALRFAKDGESKLAQARNPETLPSHA